MVETRNRWHTREMFQELYAKYPEGHIRLPAGHQYEDDPVGIANYSQCGDLDSPNHSGEIVGAFSGNDMKNL